MQVSHAKLVPLKWWDLFFFWNKRCPGTSVFVACWGPTAGAGCFVTVCWSQTAGQVVPVPSRRSGPQWCWGSTWCPVTPQCLWKPFSPAFLKGFAKEKLKKGQSSVISLDFKGISGRAGFGRRVLLLAVSLWQWIIWALGIVLTELSTVSANTSLFISMAIFIPIFINFASVLVLLDGNMAWFVVRPWALGVPVMATGAPHSLMSFSSATLDWHKGTLYRSQGSSPAQTRSPRCTVHPRIYSRDVKKWIPTLVQQFAVQLGNKTMRLLSPVEAYGSYSEMQILTCW